MEHIFSGAELLRCRRQPATAQGPTKAATKNWRKGWGKGWQPLGKASPEMVLSENDGSPKIQWLINVNHIFLIKPIILGMPHF